MIQKKISYMSGRKTHNIDIEFKNNPKYRIIVTPETHWDREWYLTFQEYRANLVLMLDELLNIIDSDPNYTNFTFDGQTIPIEDYLEVRPNQRSRIIDFVKEGRLSIGPWYCLPDEFLVSDESLVRNLMLGHKIAKSLGRVMKAGYIPDPFGHIAQLPQILYGFNIPSVLFSRGFGNEFLENNLNMEFMWKSPGNAAKVLGIHLVLGYGSACNIEGYKNINTGIYESDHKYLKKKIKILSQYIKTKNIILNNGTDHHFAKAHIPEVIKQWNELYRDKIGSILQRDFEYYVNLVLEDIKKNNITLNSYMGELHGGRYQPVLSGVFSARLWIKQWNKLCECRLQRYTEPFATINWMLTPKEKSDTPFIYPKTYIWDAWKWLLKNHPHDSICGSSVDQVHDEDMKTRFKWSQQLAYECFKNTAIHMEKLIKFDMRQGERFPIFIYNPLPTKRAAALVKLYLLINEDSRRMFSPEDFCITDETGKKIYHFLVPDSIPDRFIEQTVDVYSLNFIVEELPALGIKTYYVIPGGQMDIEPEMLPDGVLDGYCEDDEEDSININKGYIENVHYRVVINTNGTFDIYDKKLDIWFKNQGILEDRGDWGDTYDFSGPNPELKQQDSVISTLTHNFIDEISIINNGNCASIHIKYNMLLPKGLTGDRSQRSEILIENSTEVAISLNSKERKIFIDIWNDNQSKDHRLRVLFSSHIATDTIDVDGHYFINKRNVEELSKDKVKEWVQPPVPTHHQNEFTSVSDDAVGFTVMNFGLPEYEAFKGSTNLIQNIAINNANENEEYGENDKPVNLAITLVRSIGWLSRDDTATRPHNQAGPPLKTPTAQCIGENNFSLGITTHKGNWLEAKVFDITEEFICPPEVINPISLAHHNMRMSDVIIIRKFGLIDMDQLKEGNLLDSEFSACELVAETFSQTIFKQAENNNALIIRLVNLADKEKKGKIILAKKIISAKIVNLNEEEVDPKFPIKAEILKIDENVLEFSAEANVIFTLKIHTSKLK
ncbi:MAG: hypothetical protein GF364_15770 [Candidatus Lokiarchaeota archaeon]|nr:hypothetical protein [Candidatus Lokiarchaeota archaeon]